MDEQLYINFQQLINHFILHVKELNHNKSLPDDPPYLDKIACSVCDLHRSSVDIVNNHANKDEIRETGAIIHGIITQVLSTNGAMLDAARALQDENEKEKLCAIMHQYVKHPAATNVFVMELEHLSNEIDELLKAS